MGAFCCIWAKNHRWNTLLDLLSLSPSVPSCHKIHLVHLFSATVFFNKEIFMHKLHYCSMKFCVSAFLWKLRTVYHIQAEVDHILVKVVHMWFLWRSDLFSAYWHDDRLEINHILLKCVDLNFYCWIEKYFLLNFSHVNHYFLQIYRLR